MIVILEGPDGTGKTTLAKYLVKAFRGTYLHAGFKKSWNIFTYHQALLESAWVTIQKTGRPVILDRHWLSEAVYAEAFRGGSPWPLAGRIFERVIGRLGGIYVYCLPENRDEYLDNFNRIKNNRPEMFDDVTRVYDLYRAAITGDRGNIVPLNDRSYLAYLIKDGGSFSYLNHGISYDVNELGDRLGQVAELVHEVMAKLRNFNPVISDLSIRNGLGNPRYSHILLVGDWANPNKIKKRYLGPFYEHRDSSLYLAQVLNDLGASEHDLFYVNINDPHGIDVVDGWLSYRETGTTKILCLGNDAARSFRRDFPNVAACKTVHPAAARRFPEYGNKFKRDLKTFLK